MERRLWAAGMAVAATALMLAGCGGGADRSKANVRFVNASSGYAALDVLVDDVRKFASVAYGQGEAYLELDPDEIDTDVTRPGSTTPLVSLTPAVSKRDYYTLLAWGAGGALKVTQLDDNADEPDGGKTSLRVFNAATDAGSLDVFLTADTDPLADAVALQSGATVGTTTSFATLNAGTWRLRVTGAGAKSDLRLDVGGLVLGSQQIVTIVLTPGSGGVLVNALVLVQEGTITAKANTQARVRVAAGVPDSGAVTALVAGQTLMDGVGAPAIGAYTRVPAGDQLVNVSVSGTALASSTVTLEAGSDHTLLVHSPAGTPVVSWIADDNRLPVTSGKAKLRLVHSMAGNTGAMSLTADGLPVAGGVAAGAASSYAEVTPGTTVALIATAAGLASPVYSAVDRALVSGGVYTVFVLGGPSPATGLLRQDR
jgi:Domain of unknown function (DUF4397)